MRVMALGHVVIKVADRARSEAFYAGLLGLPVCAREEESGMTFFSLGDHHDFAIAEIGAGAEAPAGRAVGLAHVAFRIDGGPDALRAARDELHAAGFDSRAVDHGVSQSLYCRDPDGNGVEIYVDVSDVWKADPQAVAQSRPLEL